MDKLALLKWQMEMGADEAIGNEPVNHLKQQEAPSPVAASDDKHVSSAKPVVQKSLSPIKAEAEARRLADSCSTLEELKNALENFDGLSIKKTATNTVFSDGNSKAEIMLIGEAPGANEDIEGIPFCGASGQLMDAILKFAGFERKKNIYISNTVFWRPPGNRRPTPEELATCRPFVEKHISLIKPKLLVLVGGTATLSLLDTKIGITKLRGKFHQYKNQYLSNNIPAIAIFHPSYLLRQPMQKRVFWLDLLMIKKFCEENKIAI